MDTVRPVTSWRFVCLAGLSLCAALVGMATIAGQARADNEVSATRANEAIGIGTAALGKDLTSLSTSLSAESQVSTRARRPRVWKMPIPVAQRVTLAIARDVYNTTSPSDFDDSGAIGRRYRRQDEIGTPFCITVDFESLEDKSVTVRHRDTMSQERILIEDLHMYLALALKGA